MSKWTSPALSLFISLCWVQTAGAQIPIDDTGIRQTGSLIYGEAQASTDLGTYVASYILQPLFALSGVIFLAFILYAGILWMTDLGNSSQVSKAKAIMVHSTVGLIIMLAAYAITNLVLSLITNTPLDAQ